MSEVTRVPVKYRWDGLNWEFLKTLAEIAHYAGEKYGSPEQYANGRLEGEKSPINHIYEHLRMYTAREPHDHFGDLKHQLAAIAYNAMMEAYYLEHGGPTVKDTFTTATEERKQREEARLMQNAYQQTNIPAEPASNVATVAPSLLNRLFTSRQ